MKRKRRRRRRRRRRSQSEVNVPSCVHRDKDLTGRISKVCRAPVFRVMVSLSLAAAEESAAGRETNKTQSETNICRCFSYFYCCCYCDDTHVSLTQMCDLQRDLDGDLQRRHRAGGGAAAALLQSGEADLERGGGGGTPRSGACLL